MPWENTDFLVIFSALTCKFPLKIESIWFPTIAHTDENMDEGHKVVNEDGQSNISETASRLGLLYGSCQCILREGLKM
jgi:hypothetical protein